MIDTIIISLIALIITSLTLLLITLCLYYKKQNEEFKKDKKEKAKNAGKKFVLDVTRKHGDGSETSHWHGWDTGEWVFSYDDALERKNKINHLFHKVEILEHGATQRTTRL